MQANLLTIDKLRDYAMKLEAAIRNHRDQRGDNRCHLDDHALYSVLGEGQPNTALPPECEFLESCKRFYRQRQHPCDEGVDLLPDDMTIQQLTDEVKRLRGALEKIADTNMYFYDRDLSMPQWMGAGGITPMFFARQAISPQPKRNQ
jgi:hypothetical protein